jgi:Ca2+-transporting ATPase
MDGLLAAIAEGRTLRDNIRRAARYLVSTNASEILLMLAAATLGLEDPLTPLQLLWINLLGDTAPALALALEPSEPGVLERPPVPPGSALLPRGVRTSLAAEAAVLASGGLAAYLLSLARGTSHARARSTAAAATMAGQLLHALQHRAGAGPPSRNLVLATGAGLAVEAAALFVPPLPQLAGTVLPSPIDLALASACTLVPWAAIAVLRRLADHNNEGQESQT